DRIAERIERVVEIDAAAHPARQLGIEPGDVYGIGGSVHATDQQPLAPTRGKEFDRVVDARSSAGENDAAIGFAVQDHLVRGDAGNEPQEPDTERDRQGGASRGYESSNPAQNTGRLAAPQPGCGQNILLPARCCHRIEPFANDSKDSGWEVAIRLVVRS